MLKPYLYICRVGTIWVRNKLTVMVGVLVRRSGLCITLALLLFFILLHVTASPMQDHAANLSPTSNKATFLSAVSAPSTYSHPHSLQKRFRADIGAGWQLEVEDWDLLWPIEYATEIIEDFHSTILTMVNRELHFLQEQHQLTFRYGALQLRLDCEQAPIEWFNVAIIAEAIAEAAMRGWQGTYRLTLRHRARGVAIIAVLSVLWYGDGG